MTIKAKANLAELLINAGGPDANVWICGELVQRGKSDPNDPEIQRVLEMHRFVKSLPAGLSRAEVDALFDEWKAAQAA